MKLHSYVSRALHIEDASKARLYRLFYESAEIASLSYLLDLIFAAGIATLGLVLNSPAVVIGAMLISPLMGPIMASGLAFAAADVYLGLKAFLNLSASILASVSFSAVLVWLLPFQAPTSEILARTQPNLLDLGVAVLSGLAGSVVMARSLNGGATGALPGVAIAVALMPPLCTVGFGVGSGWNWAIISGAGLLFLTNLVAISASAFLVFNLLGMDASDVRSSITEAEMRHAAGPRLYVLLHNSAVARLLGNPGQLRWRFLMVGVTFAMLFFPLRSSLMQLRDETLSRAAALEATRSLVPADHLLSQQLEILPDRIVQRLVTTTPVEKARIATAEAELARRTAKVCSIQVRQVANEEELISLRERLRQPQLAPAPPPPPTLKNLASSAFPLLDDAVKSLWPAEAATLLQSEIGFTKETVVARLSYESPRALDAATQETIRNGLRRSLTVETLEVIFNWQRPQPRPARERAAAHR